MDNSKDGISTFDSLFRKIHHKMKIYKGIKMKFGKLNVCNVRKKNLYEEQVSIYI